MLGKVSLPNGTARNIDEAVNIAARLEAAAPPGGAFVSRAAAEVLTLFTGDEYFPGGLGEFPASKNEFLVFEDGPSVDVTLQWAKYYDAADECSLSRIYGGIHPTAEGHRLWRPERDARPKEAMPVNP